MPEFLQSLTPDTKYILAQVLLPAAVGAVVGYFGTWRHEVNMYNGLGGHWEKNYAQTIKDKQYEIMNSGVDPYKEVPEVVKDKAYNALSGIMKWQTETSMGRIFRGTLLGAAMGAGMGALYTVAQYVQAQRLPILLTK